VVLLAAAGCSADQRPRADDAASPSAGHSPGPTGSTSAPATPSGSTPTPRPSTTRSAPAPSPRLGHWKVGAHPLPLRPDGFGEVLPTPRQLRVRRLPTRDLLLPPQDGRFHATVGPVTPAVRQRMGATWEPGCPVPLSGLRYLTLSFRGFDGRAHTGELVVNASVADDVVSVFRTLYAASYPIEEMRLPTTADLDAPPTGDGNNTAAYVCRATRGATSYSAHAYGLAIDLNPFVNPYSKGDLVLPELASAYLDRSWRRPGRVEPGDVVTRAFGRVGWTWGGTFVSLKDRMHFSETGR
jgi:hypothetical protein